MKLIKNRKIQMNKSLIAILVFAISGCSAVYDKALEKINPNFFVQQKNIEEMAKELCTNSNYKVYLDKSPCNLTESSTAQITDSSKITDEQKIASEKYRKSLQEYRAEKIAFEKKYSNVLGKKDYEIFENYVIPQSDQNYQNLLSGSITWGEYNQKRIDINKEFKRRVELFSPSDEQIRNRQIQKDRENFEVKKVNFLASKSIQEFPYQADITCTTGGNQLPLMACMQNGNITTTIEVRSGQDYSMAQFMRLNIANSLASDKGVIVVLRKGFQVRMQNASREMTMNLKIVDRQTGNTVYQKSAGQFDYISANQQSISKLGSQENSSSGVYEAEISCVGQPVFTCFKRLPGVYGSFDTTLEIRSGNFYKLYQYQDLMNEGIFMRAPLGNTFEINAQNASGFFLLNIKIKDKASKRVVFEKSAGQLDFIRIRN